MFLVPGNHDHDRDIAKNLLEEAYKAQDDETDRVIDNLSCSTREELLRAFERINTVVRRPFGCPILLIAAVGIMSLLMSPAIRILLIRIVVGIRLINFVVGIVLICPVVQLFLRVCFTRNLTHALLLSEPKTIHAHCFVRGLQSSGKIALHATKQNRMEYPFSARFCGVKQ